MATLLSPLAEANSPTATPRWLFEIAFLPKTTAEVAAEPDVAEIPPTRLDAPAETVLTPSAVLFDPLDVALAPTLTEDAPLLVPPNTNGLPSVSLVGAEFFQRGRPELSSHRCADPRCR